MLRRTLPRSSSVSLSHIGDPKMGTSSSGISSGFSGFGSWDQSMRSLASHCFLLPLS